MGDRSRPPDKDRDRGIGAGVPHPIYSVPHPIYSADLGLGPECPTIRQGKAPKQIIARESLLNCREEIRYKGWSRN